MYPSEDTYRVQMADQYKLKSYEINMLDIVVVVTKVYHLSNSNKSVGNCTT
jgi:hypothetical protein